VLLLLLSCSQFAGQGCPAALLNSTGGMQRMQQPYYLLVVTAVYLTAVAMPPSLRCCNCVLAHHMLLATAAFCLFCRLLLTPAAVVAVACLRYLALDEADRMVDLGFEEEVRNKLLSQKSFLSRTVGGWAGRDNRANTRTAMLAAVMHCVAMRVPCCIHING
jgi:hypothetical protein